MADQRKEYDPMREDIHGGEQNSEHEIDTAGMRGITRQGTAQVEKDRAHQGTLENLSKARRERGENPDPTTVVQPLTTRKTPAEKRIEEKAGEGNLLARTPQEMDFGEELSREPIKRTREKDVSEERGRGGA